MYSGYFCRNCKMIPIIKGNIINNNKMKFNVKCHCNFESLTFEQINKKYYLKNIETQNIINEKIIEIEKDNELIPKINSFLIIIRNNINLLPIIKQKLIQIIKEMLKEIEELFDKAKIINENFEKTLLILINSYETLKLNDSNFINLQININNEMKKIKENFLDEINTNNFSFKKIKDLIIKTLPVKPRENHLQYFDCVSTIEMDRKPHILKLSNEYLLIKNDESIDLFSIQDLKIIAEIPSPFIIKFDINEQKNIFCLYPEYLEILPEISNNQIKSLTNNKELKIEPLIKYNMNEIYDDILCLNSKSKELYNNIIICHNSKRIFFYDYDLIKKSICLIHTYECELYNIKLINYNNKTVLTIFNISHLIFYDISPFQIINSIKNDFYYSGATTLNQISDNELIISSDNQIYLLNLNNFSIKLKINNPHKIYDICQLADKNIIIIDYACIFRLSHKTFEIVDFLFFTKEDYDYNDEFYYTNDSNSQYIEKCFQISKTKLILFSSNGEYLLYNISLI